MSRRKAGAQPPSRPPTDPAGPAVSPRGSPTRCASLASRGPAPRGARGAQRSPCGRHLLNKTCSYRFTSPGLCPSASSAPRLRLGDNRRWTPGPLGPHRDRCPTSSRRGWKVSLPPPARPRGLCSLHRSRLCRLLQPLLATCFAAEAPLRAVSFLGWLSRRPVVNGTESSAVWFQTVRVVAH